MSEFADYTDAQAFHDHEMDVGPGDWERWAGKVEDELDIDLDGSQDEDGYSLDHAYDAWAEGTSVREYVAIVRRNILDLD